MACIPMPTQLSAENAAELFMQYAEDLNGGAYKGVYEAICRAAGTEEILQDAALCEKEEAERAEQEKKRLEELERHREEERRAAEQREKERVAEIIRLQRERNEEDRRRKERLRKTFGEDAQVAEIHSHAEKKPLQNNSGFELKGKALISNNTFKVSFVQKETLPEGEATAIFTDPQGNPISNRQRFPVGRDGQETVIGFVLVSGVDFTKIKSCDLLIQTEEREVKIPFEMKISFFSDF